MLTKTTGQTVRAMYSGCKLRGPGSYTAIQTDFLMIVDEVAGMREASSVNVQGISGQARFIR